MRPALFAEHVTAIDVRQRLRFLLSYQFLILSFLCKRNLGSGLSICRYGTLVHQVWQLTDNRSLATGIYLGHIASVASVWGAFESSPIFSSATSAPSSKP
jgi:hypothetical protein